VHNANGMRLRNSVYRLKNETCGDPDAEGLFVRQLFGKIATLQILHDHVAFARWQNANVEYTDNMVALDLGRRASLSPKTLSTFLLSRKIVEKKLHSDALVELKMLGVHHNAHPALAQ